MSADADAPRRSVERLTKVQGEKLPRPIRAEILAHGAAAVAPLRDMLETGGPVAAGHAARLLGALKAIDAIPRLIELLLDPTRAEVNVGAGDGLAAMGSAAIEPLLEAQEAQRDLPGRLGLLTVLVESGVRDDRVRAAVIDGLERDTSRKLATIAARYGDPQVIDTIEALFRATEPVDQDSAERVIELGVALVAAGRFGDEHMTRMNAAYDALGKALHALRAAAGADADPLDEAEDALDGLDQDDGSTPGEVKLGRNEPCFCGSGKKFKACHGRP